jgi:hypothetical protein
MRPVVRVAATNSAISKTVEALLTQHCGRLGLRLEVSAYESAEALFDDLEQCPPRELADTLVVVYLDAADLGAAFEPRAPRQQKGWHIADTRVGLAVELLLRFPQVFPVFLSPGIPMNLSCGFPAYRTLIETLRTRHRGSNGTAEAFSLDETFLATEVPLHFVPALDPELAALRQTLSRFARGMRCWFDPTGLRTLVKNRFLGALFGSSDNWSISAEQRNVLQERLGSAAIAVDEEREFALISAYGAYKFGRRGWLVTSWGEFGDDSSRSLWAKPQLRLDDVVVLRDVDLRFPDFPDRRRGMRTRLMDIGNWEERLGEKWRVRVVSSHHDVRDISSSKSKPHPKGQPAPGIYQGLSKPISTLYNLKALLSDDGASLRSVAARLLPVQGPAEGGHGAPYSNLAIAESLLVQARTYEDGPVENILGAFLAGEAVELLLGMSQTTVLEALLLQHKKEVAAEVEFPGISHNIDISERQRDIEAAVAVVLDGSKRLRGRPRKIRKMFLSQFWAEMRIEYRLGEQFLAAEEANIRSLIHTPWVRLQMPGLPRPRAVLARLAALFRCRSGLAEVIEGMKYLIVRPVCSLRAWAMAFLVSNTFSVTLYVLAGACFRFQLVLSVILSSVTLQPTAMLSGIVDDKATLAVQAAALFHMGTSYLLFGALISMLFRKVTRG